VRPVEEVVVEAASDLATRFAASVNVADPLMVDVRAGALTVRIGHTKCLPRLPFLVGDKISHDGLTSSTTLVFQPTLMNSSEETAFRLHFTRFTY
jgi:hypothetical protein